LSPMLLKRLVVEATAIMTEQCNSSRISAAIQRGERLLQQQAAVNLGWQRQQG